MKNKIRLIIIFIIVQISFYNCQSMTDVSSTNFEGFVDTTGHSHSVPVNFDIGSPYPNPFKDHTFFSIAIARETEVTLVIQNPVGDVVKVLFAQKISPGYYRFEWDGTNDENEMVNRSKYFVTLKSDSDDFIKSQIIKFEG